MVAFTPPPTAAAILEAHEAPQLPEVAAPEELEPQVQPMVEVVDGALHEEPPLLLDPLDVARPWRPKHLRFELPPSPPAEVAASEPTPVAPPAPVASAPTPAPSEEEAVIVLSPQRDPKASPGPSYPRLARRYGWEGVAEILVQVDREGNPTSMTVYRSSGHDLLDEAAMAAIRQWHFVPATSNGQAIAGEVLVPIRFRLRPR